MSNLLDALWVDYLDGDTVSAETESKLLTVARADHQTATTWATDMALDCSLRSLHYLADSEEAFVAEWQQRAANWLQQDKLAEPPLAEPPLPGARLSGVQIFASAPPAAKEQRVTPASMTQATAALVATVALLALVAFSFWIFSGNGGLARRDVPQPKNSPNTPSVTPEKLPSEEPDEPFRFVVPAPEREPQQFTPVWQTGGPQNNRLPRGEHRLTSGMVELIGGKATPVTIAAPAEVRVGDDDSWFVQQGTITVSDLPSGERLPIVTPNSRIRSQGAEFVVKVDSAGQTDLQVRRGEVHLLSDAAGENAAPLKLMAGEFERALLSAPAKEAGTPGDLPAFCQLQGPADRFCGLIELDGKTLRFAAPAEFQEFQRQVEQQFAKDAEEFRRQWPDLVRALGGLGGGEIQLQRDGKPVEVQSLEQLLELLKQLPVPPGGVPKPGVLPGVGALPGVPGDAKGNFQGTIIINGEEQKFNSVEEFNAARKKALDQLGPLPIDIQGLDPLIPKDLFKLFDLQP